MKQSFAPSVIAMLTILVFPAVAGAEVTADQKKQALDQAKREYAIYLQELKALSGQYKQITEAMKEVISDEGLPAWSDETGEIEVAGAKRTVLGHSFVDVDVQEAEKDMTVKMDLPGVNKDTIKAVLKNETTLQVNGESNSAKLKGPFEQVVSLPAKAKPQGIEARYDNGVLTIKIPKQIETVREVTIPVR